MPSEAVIVGSYQTPYVKNPTETTLYFILKSIGGVLNKYGISPTEVDGLGVSSFLMGPDNTTTIAEQSGICAKWTYQGSAGGAAHVAGVLDAQQAIINGSAETVVISAADSYSVAVHNKLMNDFNSSMRDYIAPHGFGGTNGLFAMLQRKHMADYGTTREQLGKLSVIQRENAAHNENALLRTPLTIEDYLNCRQIAEPIGLYDCVMPCGGGESTLLMSKAKAESLGLPYVEILAGDYRSNYGGDQFLLMSGAWAEFQSEMFSRAQISHSDIDVVGLYDDYPIMEVIQLEGLGFCPQGEGGRFIEDTDISVIGDLSINTGGGQLSCGQTGAGGGAIALTEVLMQMNGEVEVQRQVPGPELGVVSGFGMIGFGKGTGQSAMILKKG